LTKAVRADAEVAAGVEIKDMTVTFRIEVDVEYRALLTQC
jgi:hypothetical protein